MKKIRILSAIGILFLMVWVATASTTTTILFNEYPAITGSCSGLTQFYLVGTEWSAFDISLSNVVWYADDTGHDPFPTPCGITTIYGSTSPGVVTFTAGPVDSVTVDWVTAPDTTITIEAYDAINTLLGSFTGTGSGTNTLTFQGKISYIEFHDGGSQVAISDLIYTSGTTQIPEVSKDFRFTNVSFGAIPAELGTLLPQSGGKFNAAYVAKDGTVSSTNPGQLYGVITINGTGAQNVSIDDTFGTQFKVNPAKLGGGVEVLRVNAITGVATDITNTLQITSASVDNTLHAVKLTINLAAPLAVDEKLMIYVKFQTALKGKSPDYNDFVNMAGTVINGGAPQTATATINFVRDGSGESKE